MARPDFPRCCEQAGAIPSRQVSALLISSFAPARPCAPIEARGYWRRKEELEDAEEAASSW
jgi:hypothetical protein